MNFVCLHLHVSYHVSLNVAFPIGTTVLHLELEECVANFVGKPAAIVFGMGYVTNSAILPVLMGKVCEIEWFYLVETLMIA